MQPEDLVGQTLGHYRIKRQIGYGGMATVFLGEDIHLNREVALKVFWPRPGETQDFLRRFAREARVLAQLDHPHILQVYEYGEQGELAFLVTPYLSGGTLKDVLRARKVLPPSEAVEMLLQVLPALQYAHDRNLIHRDIKPGNLLFKGDGSLVLADFGLVKVVQGEGEDTQLHTLSQTGQNIAGTPEYMSPEQIEGKAVAASDIYSLGIILYEMVTGVRPFTGDTLLSVLMKHVNEPARSPRELNPYISPQLESIIQRALAKDPQRRFASPKDFQQALRQLTNPASNPGIVGLAQGAEDEDYTTQKTENSATLAAEWTQGQAQADGANGTARQTSGSQPNRQPLLPTPNQVAANPWQQGAAGFPAQAGGRTATPLPPVQTQGYVRPEQPAQMWGMSQTIPPALTPTPPYTPPKRSRTPTVILSLLVVLLAGLVASLFLTPMGSALFGSHTPTATATVGTPGVSPTGRGGVTATPGSTQGMPTTLTTCPANGQARAAVIKPLALGSAPTIVYLVNENDGNGGATFGTVKIYNTSTGQKTEIAKNKTGSLRINEAQVSNDGQWVLFAATVNGQDQLRMVRLDGQGLQTLLCAPDGWSIRGSQLSFNQQNVIFDEAPANGVAITYLLNLQTGALQAEVTSSATNLALLPRTWLDDHHVLLTGFVPNSGAPQQNIYVLNIDKGANQSVSDASQVYISSQPCWDFDSSWDAHSLFITQCIPSQPHGISTLSQQPVNGGSTKTILNSTTLALSSVRVIDHKSSQVLAIADDSGQGMAPGDPANDGLYLIKTDGTVPQRLVKTPAGQLNQLCAYSQNYWANVSRDVSLYAVETTTPSTKVYEISYGSLNGGTPTPFVSISDGTTMSVAGWTTT